MVSLIVKLINFDFSRKSFSAIKTNLDETTQIKWETNQKSQRKQEIIGQYEKKTKMSS